MMIKDEVFKTSIYDCPPENLDAACERGQLLFDEDKTLSTCREARDGPPESEEDIDHRMTAAGINPTNMIGMVWKNVDQFKDVLSRYGWKTELYCHSKTMDAGRYKVLMGIAQADRRNKISFVLWEKPHQLVVLMAKTLSASRNAQKVLKEVADLIQQYSGAIDEV